MKIALTSFAAALAPALPAAAQEAPKEAPSPGAIVAAAPAKDWVAIAPADLLVMTLAGPAHGPRQAVHDPGSGSGAGGTKRQVVIQLIPAPFSQGWVGNVRKLAAAHWWDGLAITRVQDNYVVQWGDPEAEDKARAKPLPARLAKVPESEYLTRIEGPAAQATLASAAIVHPSNGNAVQALLSDPYAFMTTIVAGFPIGLRPHEDAPPPKLSVWPVHCYGMVGVGRNYSPDTGSGTELYTVIGHAPRHLDRNIALVGRVVEGIEHLSSLPRGTGALGFYEKADQRVPIVSIRLASELPAAEQPRFQYLSTESESFARYADARANRRDPFFIVPAGGADICNIPVPVRRAK